MRRDRTQCNLSPVVINFQAMRAILWRAPTAAKFGGLSLPGATTKPGRRMAATGNCWNHRGRYRHQQEAQDPSRAAGESLPSWSCQAVEWSFGCQPEPCCKNAGRKESAWMGLFRRLNTSAGPDRSTRESAQPPAWRPLGGARPSNWPRSPSVWTCNERIPRPRSPNILARQRRQA